MDLFSQEEDEKRPRLKRIFLFRQIISCTPIILNFFIYGLYLGSTTVIVPQLRKEANTTDAVTPEMASWLCSISSYSAVPWGIIIPLLAYRYGQKKILILLSLNVLAGNILFYVSANITELIISQAIQGMLMASTFTITIMVMSEHTSPRYRGVILTSKSATYFWGITVANAIGTFFHWRVIGIVVFICCIFYISILFCHESPYWLAMKGRFDECAKVHRWLKGTDKDAEEELRKLILTQQEYLNYTTNANGRSNKLLKFLYVVRYKNVYKSLVYSFLLICLHNLSGKVAYTVYAIDLIKDVTSSEKTAYEGMLILDAVTVLGMYVGSALTKYISRRKHLFVFACTAAAFLYLLSIFVFMVKFNIILESKYISLLLLTGFSVSISCGPMVLTNCCIAELSPLRYRNYFVCYISMLISAVFATNLKFAPLVFEIFGLYGAFLFYAISTSILVFILYLYLPETKDKTILEIQTSLLGNDCSNAINAITESIPLRK